jgi:hypothetical protein
MTSLVSSVADRTTPVPAQIGSKIKSARGGHIAADNKREQTIRERAYAIWEQEGRPSDRSLPNWLKAEAEIETGQCERMLDTPVMAKRSKPIDRREPHLRP